eukprot:Ihof_evm7s220 gene=Ihof_evmTU7s220
MLLCMLIFFLVFPLPVLYLIVRTKSTKDVAKSNGSKLTVAFIHPDLGIGGAERLVVDAALALQSQGHKVHMYTAHHDPSHCFIEARDGTIPVSVYGDTLPRAILGRMYALCAYIRMCYVAMVMITLEPVYDVIICDQVSACIPILRLSQSKVMFYCHYPDQLLATDRRSILKRLYRWPLDWFEELTTGMADCVVVNSKFTAGVFKQTFTNLSLYPAVLYPSINFSAFDNPPKDDSENEIDNQIPPRAKTVLLSINRFERKKNLQLAIDTLVCLKESLSADRWNSVHLVIAGGYDDRVIENKEYYEELRISANKNGVDGHVTFVKSFTDAQKLRLLDRCTCLLYTADKEHFGIGPLEAMYANRMVIAMASGGPLETVVDGVTGRHCDATAQSWATAITET